MSATGLNEHAGKGIEPVHWSNKLGRSSIPVQSGNYYLFYVIILHFFIIITSLLCCMNLRIITPLLRDYYILSHHYYVIITHYYTIIT